MDALDSVIDPLREFAKDSSRLVKRCHKLDQKGILLHRAEFSKVASRVAIGFVVMGFVGFFVKLIFIPINNIIVGLGSFVVCNFLMLTRKATVRKMIAATDKTKMTVARCTLVFNLHQESELNMGENSCTARCVSKYWQVFMEATREGSLTFVVGKFDGILGLGFKEISVGDVVPVWYNMMEQGIVQEEIFSFWLNRVLNAREGGELVLGGVDEKHFNGHRNMLLHIISLNRYLHHITMANTTTERAFLRED